MGANPPTLSNTGHALNNSGDRSAQISIRHLHWSFLSALDLNQCHSANWSANLPSMSTAGDAKAKRSLLAAAVLTMLFMSSQSSVEAQTRDPSLQAIRTAIVQAIGVDENSVEVSITRNVLKVSRVNSNLKQTDHSARDGEATRIANVVAKTIAGNTAYKNVHTIRVTYVATLRLGGYEKVIDTVDFRRDPSGVFQFHTT